MGIRLNFECTSFVMSQNRRRRAARTDNHARTDVTELRFLAVVVLELVRPVVDWFDWFRWRRLILLFFFHLLVIDEIYLEK